MSRVFTPPPLEIQMVSTYLISQFTLAGAYRNKYIPEADSAQPLHTAIEAYCANQMTSGLFDHGDKVCFILGLET